MPRFNCTSNRRRDASILSGNFVCICRKCYMYVLCDIHRYVPGANNHTWPVSGRSILLSRGFIQYSQQLLAALACVIEIQLAIRISSRVPLMGQLYAV